MIRELNLREYRTLDGVALTVSERDTLRAIAPSISMTPTAGASDRYDLTPGSEVGVVQTESLNVVILPKLPISRVLFLLSYALGAGKFRDEQFRFEEAPDLLEAIIPGFAAQVRTAFRRGLLQGYRSEEDALPTVRGRIRFEDQLRDRFGIFPPVEVRFDDYTEDIDLNRLIKSAISRLGRMRIKNDTARNELRAFDRILARVSPVEYAPSQVPQPTFSRLNEHYEPAAVLAQMILRSASFEMQRGKARATAFLLDMNVVFENFVVVALRDALRLDARSFPQGAAGRQLRLSEAGKVVLKPDLSWWDGRRCVFVGDVKYKKTKAAAVPNADLYQLLAYTTATDLPGGLLIYAAGEDEPITHHVVHAGKMLEIVTLDLAGDPSQMLHQIDRVADQIRELRALSLVA